VAVNHATLVQPFGTGGADIILTQHFKHCAARQSGNYTGRNHGQGGGRQDQMPDQVFEITAAIDRIHAGCRKNTPMNGEEINQQKSKPE
jgi:hypothetical protein